MLHKLSVIRHKLKSKQKLKELKLSDVAIVADDLAPNDVISTDAPLSVAPQLPVDSPLVSNPNLDVRIAEKLSSVQDNLFSQFSSMFTDFAKQLESRFTRIDEKFNSLDSSAISVSHSSVPVSQEPINVGQDVSNPFAAPTSVAVLTRHADDKAFYAPQQGGLEIPLGGVAAEDALSSGSSLPLVDLGEFEGAVKYFIAFCRQFAHVVSFLRCMFGGSGSLPGSEYLTLCS